VDSGSSAGPIARDCGHAEIIWSDAWALRKSRFARILRAGTHTRRTDIGELRQPPELPDAYFEVYETLEAQVRAYPLVARPRNRALLHALLAFEILAHRLRPLGEREIHVRRQHGLPVGTNMFAMAMHGCHRGLTILLRAIDNAAVPDLRPTEPDGSTQDEAGVALKGVNGLIDEFTALDDVAIGWRDCTVEGKHLKIPSKSPERFARSIELDVRSEAEHNEPYLRASAAARHTKLLHLRLRLAAMFVPRWGVYEPDGRTLELAEAGTRLAGDHISGWTIPVGTIVTRAFTAGEYRAASEALKAYGGALQIFDDYREPRDPPRLSVRTPAAWIELLQSRTSIDPQRLAAIIRFLTHAASDVRGQGRISPAAAHTPLLDLGDGRLALAPTLAIWHGGELALRTIWKMRAPDDYNARVSALNHELSEQAGDLFAAKGWPRIVRRNVPGGGDIDAGTGADELFISGECKVFIDDPVRGADDPAVWRDLQRNVHALEEPAMAARVLEKERLTPRHIMGLVIVPGRAQSPVDFGDRYALVGIDDLKDRVAESATPHDLWRAIKSHEVQKTVEVAPVTSMIDDWTLESDGVRRADLIAPASGR
jgi:hypothetical protein